MDGFPVKGSDERNFSSLILIPTQERLPRGLTRIERHMTRSDLQIVRVLAEGLDLAHGLDNDILVGLVNLFIEAGCPPDGEFEASAYQVLTMAGLPADGHYYRALAGGLNRLKGTVFTITEGWFEEKKKRFISMSFSIIDNYDRTENEEGLDERSRLRIRLNRNIVRSINAGYLKPLDLAVYRQLDSVGARTLYRLLDSYLYRAAESEKQGSYTLNLPMESVAAACGLLDERSDNMRRNIERMHQSLLEIGYLQQADLIGRGKKTTLHYVFGSDVRPTDSETVTLLTD